MKKELFVFLALAFPLAVQAAGTPVCTGTSTGGDVTVSPAGTPLFIVSGFTMKCSQNVFLSYEENATAVGVASASKKGKNIFRGGSAGGQVKQGSACGSTSACTAAEVTSATGAALAGS